MIDLMFYRADGTGHAIALERITGTLGGRSGSFVLQHNGTFAAGALMVLPGSGTGELAGLRGEGQLIVQEQPWSIELDYTFEAGVG